jgi:hypothetical protein
METPASAARLETSQDAAPVPVFPNLDSGPATPEDEGEPMMENLPANCGVKWEELWKNSGYSKFLLRRIAFSIRVLLAVEPALTSIRKLIKFNQAQ